MPELKDCIDYLKESEDPNELESLQELIRLRLIMLKVINLRNTLPVISHKSEPVSQKVEVKGG